MISWDVFSLYTNTRDCYEKGKTVNFSKDVYIGRYRNQNKLIKSYCERIACEINNHYFTLEDFKCYLIHHYLLHETLFWSQIKIKKIPKIAPLFSKNKLYKDKELMLEISLKTEINDMETLYRVNSNGNNILMDFIEKGRISPVFYLKFFPKEFPISKYSKSRQIKIINETIKKIKKNKGEKEWLQRKLKEEK